MTFLSREVRAWSRDNACFSCHNNGDGARALFAASAAGMKVPDSALSDTTAWLRTPERWDDNKGDPGFSDKRLADIQFAAALVSAVDAAKVEPGDALKRAAGRLIAGQSEDGSWKVDAGNPAGSPATYGVHLATAMAVRTLRRAGTPEAAAAVGKAETWMSKQRPASIAGSGALLLAHARSMPARQRDACIEKLRAAQTRGGGWGPYADSPAEPFDTAVGLLALSEVRDKPGVEAMIHRGRSYLAKEQHADGSWPATTRPPGGESYAQRLSTAGWATLALLTTRPKQSRP